MGVVRFQNEALNSPMVLALEKITENEWERSTSQSRHETIEELISFVLIGFGAGLRGEEVPLVLLQGLLNFSDGTRSDPYPFIMITLYG